MATLGLAVVAWIEWGKADEQTGIANKATEKAERQAKIATSRELATLTAAELDKRLDRALLLGVEALRAYDTFEARALYFGP